MLKTTIKKLIGLDDAGRTSADVEAQIERLTRRRLATAEQVQAVEAQIIRLNAAREQAILLDDEEDRATRRSAVERELADAEQALAGLRLEFDTLASAVDALEVEKNAIVEREKHEAIERASEGRKAKAARAVKNLPTTVRRLSTLADEMRGLLDEIPDLETKQRLFASIEKAVIGNGGAGKLRTADGFSFAEAQSISIERLQAAAQGRDLDADRRRAEVESMRFRPRSSATPKIEQDAPAGFAALGALQN